MQNLLTGAQFFAPTTSSQVMALYQDSQSVKDNSFAVMAGSYLLSMAIYLESGAQRPACTLAHITALVQYPNTHHVVLTLATEPAVKDVLAAIVGALEQRAYEQVEGVVKHLRDLFAHLNPGPTATKQVAASIKANLFPGQIVQGNHPLSFVAIKPQQIYDEYLLAQPEKIRTNFYTQTAANILFTMATFLDSSATRPACSWANVVAMLQYPAIEKTLRLIARQSVAKNGIQCLLREPDLAESSVIKHLRDFLSPIKPGKEAEQRIAQLIETEAN